MEDICAYDAKERAEELVIDNENYLVHDPTTTLDSPTSSKDGERLQEIINDATYNYMLGEIDEEEFNKGVKKWKEQGGDKIIEEFNN
jgi:putative aldouronate transport system substrate-binding protein